MKDRERIKSFVKEWFPDRHLTNGKIRVKANWYWVKRAIRVLQTDKQYQLWVSSGMQCATPGSKDLLHTTETVERLIEVFNELGY